MDDALSALGAIESYKSAYLATCSACGALVREAIARYTDVTQRVADPVQCPPIPEVINQGGKRHSIPC